MNICNLSHFADEFASAVFVGHMYFKCDEIHLSLAFYMYHHNLSNFSVIYLLIHVKSWLPLDVFFRIMSTTKNALNGIFFQRVVVKCVVALLFSCIPCEGEVLRRYPARASFLFPFFFVLARFLFCTRMCISSPTLHDFTRISLWTGSLFG